MKYSLATACDLNYIDGATALLKSVRSCHPEVTRICFAIPSEIREIQQILGDLACVIPPPRNVHGVTDKLQITAVRIFITTLDADVVVWADCDTIFSRPAPELWKVCPGTVNAVQNIDGHQVSDNVPADIRTTFRKQFPELDGLRGFNSGVIALRPIDWPGLPERFEAIISQPHFAYHSKFFDQPILNAIMLSRVRWLSREYNASSLFDLPIPSGVRVVHFTSSPKPWMKNFPRHEPAYYYWLRYGIGEKRFFSLAKACLKIWVRMPLRMLGRIIKQRHAA